MKLKICEERKEKKTQLKTIIGEEIQLQNAKGCFEEKGSQSFPCLVGTRDNERLAKF